MTRDLPARTETQPVAVLHGWRPIDPYEAAADKLTMSRKLVRALGSLMPDDQADSAVELLIVVDDYGLSARDWAAYLNLANHVHGRALEGNLRWFSPSEARQLEIAEVRPGSLILIIPELVGQLHSKEAIVLTWLLLKFLPDIIKAPAHAYRDYQEGALVRERRQRLRQRIEQDEQFGALDRARRNELVHLIDRLLERDRTLLPSARRFARKSIRDVFLRMSRRRDR